MCVCVRWCSQTNLKNSLPAGKDMTSVSTVMQRTRARLTSLRKRPNRENEREREIEREREMYRERERVLKREQ